MIAPLLHEKSGIASSLCPSGIEGTESDLYLYILYMICILIPKLLDLSDGVLEKHGKNILIKGQSSLVDRPMIRVSFFNLKLQLSNQTLISTVGS